MHSCIYRGHTEHCRLTPTEHRFRYPISQLYLDLDELPILEDQLRWLSRRKFAPLSFHVADHDENAKRASTIESLQNTIRDRVESATGSRPGGAIRLLTPLRHFGHYFSPLSLFYCFEPAANSTNGESLAAVVGEVTNTPWREKHWYVLGSHNATNRYDAASQSGGHGKGEAKETPANIPAKNGSQKFGNAKQFHVSPFMEMGLWYDWSLTAPAESLRVAIRAYPDSADLTGEAEQVKRSADKPKFVASVDLDRRPLSDFALIKMLLRYPLAPLQTLTAIHYEALRLWLKKVPYIPHPGKVSGPTKQVLATTPDETLP